MNSQHDFFFISFNEMLNAFIYALYVNAFICSILICSISRLRCFARQLQLPGTKKTTKHGGHCTVRHRYLTSLLAEGYRRHKGSQRYHRATTLATLSFHAWKKLKHCGLQVPEQLLSNNLNTVTKHGQVGLV